MINTNLSKLIDDDRDATAVIRREDSIEERCFARPEKAGQDDDGGFFRAVAIIHVMHLCRGRGDSTESERLSPQPRVDYQKDTASNQTYAKVFDEERTLDKLETFSLLNDPAHCGLPPNQGTMTLERISSVASEDITVPGLDEWALIYRGGKIIG